MAIDYSRFAIAKPVARVIERAARRRQDQKQLEAAKNAAWAKCGNKCERCGRRVERGSVDSLRTGHAHHRIYRSRGGKHIDLEIVCARCHAEIHGGRVK